LTKTAFISIGSNINPEINLPIAVKKLVVLGTPIKVSTVFQNTSIGSTPGPDFLNAAASIETSSSPMEIRTQLRNIEHELGRVRTADRFAPRTMDLDLCLLGDIILELPEFTLPDPELLDRPHLAIPMAALDPDFIHPITQERLSDIAERLMPTAELTPRPDIQLTFS
jgi:2-amino-4-hydroxy-6-hydroxymethyldihydropteridine diphosphokinase